MNLLAIARKDVLLLLRDRKALLTLIGTPLILTFILGLAFSAMWSSQQPPSLILWLNPEAGGYADILFEEVFEMEGIREWVVLEEVASRQEALERVRLGRATAFIEIPTGFSQAVRAGQAVITVAGDPASSIRANIIIQIVNRFASEISSRVVVHTALRDLGADVLPEQVEAALAVLQVETLVEDGFTADEEVRDELVPMDYYAAGMGVMYLLFTVTHGASTFLRERETHTLARMYQSPVRPWEISAGKFSGIFAIAVFQMTAVITFSTLFYGVRWGNPWAVAGLTAAAAFAASGVGLLIAAVSKSHSAANAMGTAIVLPMSVLGGSMVPLFALPPLVRTLSKFTINGWALDGYVRLMYEGAALADVLGHMVILSIFGIVLVSVASRVLARRGVVS